MRDTISLIIVTQGMCVNWVGIYYMIEQRVRINIATSVHMMICADI